MKLMYISDGEMCLFDGASTRVIPSQRVDQYARTLRQLERPEAAQQKDQPLYIDGATIDPKQIAR